MTRRACRGPDRRDAAGRSGLRRCATDVVAQPIALAFPPLDPLAARAGSTGCGGLLRCRPAVPCRQVRAPDEDRAGCEGRSVTGAFSGARTREFGGRLAMSRFPSRRAAWSPPRDRGHRARRPLAGPPALAEHPDDLRRSVRRTRRRIEHLRRSGHGRRPREGRRCCRRVRLVTARRPLGFPLLRKAPNPTGRRSNKLCWSPARVPITRPGVRDRGQNHGDHPGSLPSPWLRPFPALPRVRRVAQSVRRA